MSKKFLFSISLAFMLSQAYISYGQDPYLVGWWKFDDGGGAIASDSSGKRDPRGGGSIQTATSPRLTATKKCGRRLDHDRQPA